MKPGCKLLMMAFCLAAALPAQRPPLIDRELFFGDPEIAGAQLSPDGKYIAFLKPWKQTRNIWVKKTEEPFGAARIMTAETKRPIPGFFWSRDGQYLLFVQDSGGDENYNVYAVKASDQPQPGSDAPPARNLTEAKGVRAMIYGIPKSAPDILYAGLNDRDKAWHDLYEIKISTGERKLLRKNTDRITGWIFDNKDRLRMATRSADSGDTEFLRVDPDGMQKIYSCTVFETCSPVAFEKADGQFYVVTNKGEPNLISIALMDPKTGETKLVESDPLKRVDASGIMISDTTHEMVATLYYDEKLRIYWKNKDWEQDYRRVEKQLPGREVRGTSGTADERLWLMTAYSDTEPGEIYLFDRRTKKLTLQYRNREKLPRQHLAPMTAVRYESSDGWEIPAYLTLPKGVDAKNLPVIVVPHGGPWGRDMWGYNGMPQFLANRGYAVLQPNFRGSTGYGKKFLDGGNLQWGQKMQDDVTWGAKYLVQKGIADPKRIAIMGGSYGGYATLAGVTFTPDTYAAAVDIVGPSNLLTLIESIPPYWEPIRMMFYKRMGDPRTPEGKAQLERQSPLNSAAKIHTPLLVVQGANDPRVNKREADQIVVALRDRGFPVEYLVAPDEGHGFARPVNSLAMFTAAEKFLAKHLGGQYQEEVSPEVATRLKEITVDPKTVTISKPLDASPVTLPKVVGTLPEGTSKWSAKIKSGGQEIGSTVTVTVKSTADGLVINHTMGTPMGDVIDIATLDSHTLEYLKRQVKQGPVTIDIAVKGGKMVGSIDMGGQAKPVEAETGGPLFADGTGGRLAIACLPLAEGYTATFRNFDLQRMKPKLMQLKVAATEKVTVAAGTFETFRVEITSAEGTAEQMTLWVAKESRTPVKMALSMGPTSISAELQ